MNRDVSLLLDLLRFFAAIAVLIHHGEQLLDLPLLSPYASFGHDAVIFFFILSGFVIGYASHAKASDFRAYFVARSARVYSVAIPSLILVGGLLWLGTLCFGEHYEAAAKANGNWPWITLNSLFFLNFTSFGVGSVPTNGPYWSLSYEVFYYLIFGVAFYLQGLKKYLTLLLLVMVTGLKIIILMPLWLAGYWFYLRHQKIKPDRLFGILLVAGSLIVYAIMRVNNIDDGLVKQSADLLFASEAQANDVLRYSKRFVSDYLIAALFITLLVGLFKVVHVIAPFLSAAEGPIRKLASYSFAIYLFHFPLFIFVSYIDANHYVLFAIVTAGTMAMGHVTERKKHVYKVLINQLIR